MPVLGLENIGRRINVLLDGKLSPAELGKFAGNYAKQHHEEMIIAGRAPAVFQRYVNGVLNAPETSVRFGPGKPGVIEYKGTSLLAAATFALQVARERSVVAPGPYGAGTYKAAWVLFADGQPTSIERFPPNAQQAMVVNFTPYSRRLEQARRRNRPQYQVTQIVTQLTKARYGGLSIRRQFVQLPPIPSGRQKFQVPYVLQRPPGGQMLYPAVVIEVRH
jgi:hypothetical protein